MTITQQRIDVRIAAEFFSEPVLQRLDVVEFTGADGEDIAVAETLLRDGTQETADVVIEREWRCVGRGNLAQDRKAKLGQEPLEDMIVRISELQKTSEQKVVGDEGLDAVVREQFPQGQSARPCRFDAQDAAIEQRIVPDEDRVVFQIERDGERIMRERLVAAAKPLMGETEIVVKGRVMPGSSAIACPMSFTAARLRPACCAITPSRLSVCA